MTCSCRTGLRITCPVHGDGAKELDRDEDLLNEALELAYWTFDARRSGTYAPRRSAGLGTDAERDAFKSVVRELLGKMT